MSAARAGALAATLFLAACEPPPADTARGEETAPRLPPAPAQEPDEAAEAEPDEMGQDDHDAQRSRQ